MGSSDSREGHSPVFGAHSTASENKIYSARAVSAAKLERERERASERERERGGEGETERQRGRETDRDRDRQTDRQR